MRRQLREVVPVVGSEQRFDDIVEEERGVR
jgi:hypothetical protein